MEAQIHIYILSLRRPNKHPTWWRAAAPLVGKERTKNNQIQNDSKLFIYTCLVSGHSWNCMTYWFTATGNCRYKQTDTQGWTPKYKLYTWAVHTCISWEGLSVTLTYNSIKETQQRRHNGRGEYFTFSRVTFPRQNRPNWPYFSLFLK